MEYDVTYILQGVTELDWADSKDRSLYSRQRQLLFIPVYDLLVLASNYKLIVFSLVSSEVCTSAQGQPSRWCFSTQLSCPWKVIEFKYISKWEGLIALLSNKELYFIPIRAILKHSDAECSQGKSVQCGRNLCEEKQDIFNDLLNKQSITYSSQPIQSLVSLSIKNVVNFIKFESYLIVLKSLGKLLTLSLVSMITTNTFKEHVVFQDTILDEESSNFVFPVLLAVPKTLLVDKDITRLDNCLLTCIAGSDICFSDSFITFIGCPSGFVYSAILSLPDSSLQSTTNALQTSKKDLFNVICHLNEPVHEVISLTSNYTVEEMEGKVTDTLSKKLVIKEILAVIGKHGKVKLIYTSSDAKRIKFVSIYIEGPVVDHVYFADRAYFFIVSRVNINLYKVIWKCTSHNKIGQKVENEWQPDMKFLSSIPVTNVYSLIQGPTSVLVYGPDAEGIIFFGVMKTNKIFLLRINSSNLDEPSGTCQGLHSTTNKLLKEMKSIDKRRNITTRELQTRNSVLVQLNLVTRIFSYFYGALTSSSNLPFYCDVDTFLTMGKSNMSFYVTFCNKSTYSLFNGWFLLINVQTKRNTKEKVFSYVHKLPVVHHNGNHSFLFEIQNLTLLPTIVDIYLEYNVNTLKYCSIIKDNTVIPSLHILKKHISILDIAGLFQQSVIKHTTIPYISMSHATAHNDHKDYRPELKYGTMAGIPVKYSQNGLRRGEYTFQLLFDHQIVEDFQEKAHHFESSKGNDITSSIPLLTLICQCVFQKKMPLKLNFWNGQNLVLNIDKHECHEFMLNRSKELPLMKQFCYTLNIQSSCLWTVCEIHKSLCKWIKGAMKDLTVDEENPSLQLSLEQHKEYFSTKRKQVEEELNTIKTRREYSFGILSSKTALEETAKDLLNLVVKCRTLSTG